MQMPTDLQTFYDMNKGGLSPNFTGSACFMLQQFTALLQVGSRKRHF